MYSATEHLARTVWLGRFSWSNRMAFYSAYFDESGHPDDSLSVIVAGCVADVEQWVHFEREWLLALEPFNTRIFHAVDFEQGKPPFDTLTAKDKTDTLRKLLGIIRRRAEKTMCHIVPIEVYKELNSRYVFSECYGFPYPAGARACMSEVEQWALHHSVHRDYLKFVFEDGAKHKGQIQWIAERDGLPTPIFQKKHEAVPLQAGDLISWMFNRIISRQDETYAMLLEELEESHSCIWILFTVAMGNALARFSNIGARDPNSKYKCQILRKDGKRIALVHYWPKTEKQPRIDRKTLQIPDALPPLSGCSKQEIESSVLLSKLAKSLSAKG